MAWDTAASIINDAAVELGLLVSDVADPYASSDVNLAQLCRLLKSLGQDLVRDYQWTHLKKQWTFATQAGLANYEMPPDYNRFVDQTGWNRTQQMPLLGPLSAQGWQLLQVLTSAGTADVMYRLVGGEFVLYPTPQSNNTIAYEYISSHWVGTGGSETPNADAPTSGGDTLFFDGRLLVCGLKLKWQRAKGFDSTACQDDYDKALARAQGGDGAAPVLSLNHRPFSQNRMLDCANVPETGFGQ
ncbi:putative tail protein [Myxococcus phage Mx9]|nr:putative tail protein [Myxococcus phage Mx9]